MVEIKEVVILAEYEGYSIEEAKLTYAARQKLPTSAFCGPEKSYPAHDAKHVRAGLQRLSQFGRKMPKAVAAKVYRCLLRRAKKYGVEHDPKKFVWLTGKKSIEETFAEVDAETEELLDFLDEELGLEVGD